MSNLSPNQFALPGMEEHAHPLARYLRDVHFRTPADVQPTARKDMDDPRGPTYTVPRSFDPPVSEHNLEAIVPGQPDRFAGELHWRGDNPGRQYPGEISWVSRGDAYVSSDLPATPGLMTSMFHFAHEQVQPGQRTVPVHSPERSKEGEAWSAKVGPPELRPRRGDDAYRPPAGIHPFERAGSPPQLVPAMEGQLHLPGVAGHVLRAQREVALKNMKGKIGEGRTVGRARAIATFHNGVRVR